jgi:hypothetical protein
MVQRRSWREQFELFVSAGGKRDHCEEYYPLEERRILGAEEVVEETKKRKGIAESQARHHLKAILNS